MPRASLQRAWLGIAKPLRRGREDARANACLFNTCGRSETGSCWCYRTCHKRSSVSGMLHCRGHTVKQYCAQSQEWARTPAHHARSLFESRIAKVTYSRPQFATRFLKKKRGGARARHYEEHTPPLLHRRPTPANATAQDPHACSAHLTTRMSNSPMSHRRQSQ